MNPLEGSSTSKFTIGYIKKTSTFFLCPKSTFKLQESSPRYSILEFVEQVHVSVTNILHGQEFDCVPFHPSFFCAENFSSGLTIIFHSFDHFS